MVQAFLAFPSSLDALVRPDPLLFLTDPALQGARQVPVFQVVRWVLWVLAPHALHPTLAFLSTQVTQECQEDRVCLDRLFSLVPLVAPPSQRHLEDREHPQRRFFQPSQAFRADQVDQVPQTLQAALILLGVPADLVDQEALGPDEYLEVLSSPSARLRQDFLVGLGFLDRLELLETLVVPLFQLLLSVLVGLASRPSRATQDDLFFLEVQAALAALAYLASLVFRKRQGAREAPRSQQLRALLSSEVLLADLAVHLLETFQAGLVDQVGLAETAAPSQTHPPDSH